MTARSRAVILFSLRRVILALVVVALIAEACGDGEDGAAETSAASTTIGAGETIVIRTRLTIAATPESEPIATGEVLEGSTLGGSPFCVGATVLDTHASTDPAEESYGPIDRTITCPDGAVRVGLTPELSQGLTNTGSWRIVSGTGAFEGLRGSGEMEGTNDPDDDSPHETHTGTVTR